MPRTQHKGVVMVKPHAFEQTLTPLVADTLDDGQTAARLKASDPLKSFLGQLEVGTPIIRDLRTFVAGQSLLNIFYEDKRDRRYFPLIMERYAGRVAFLPYSFYGYSEELPRLYEAMKGSAETFDASGRLVSQASGVRGLLSPPYEALDSKALLLGDADYRKRCLPMVDNVFHVCDTRLQNEQALQLLSQ